MNSDSDALGPFGQKAPNPMDDGPTEATLTPTPSLPALGTGGNAPPLIPPSPCTTPPPPSHRTRPPEGRSTHLHTLAHTRLTLYFHLASDLLLVCSRISSLSMSFCELIASLLGTLRTLFVA